MNIHYGPQGYEASYHPEKKICVVNVRGYELPDGTLVERKGSAHPNDKIVATFVLHQTIPVPMFDAPAPARETFVDVLVNQRDLLGNLILRNNLDISDHAIKTCCASAYEAGQKIQDRVSVFSANKLVFNLAPSLFAFIGCFARSENGEFWLLDCSSSVSKEATDRFSLAAYIMETGGYIPSNTVVRCGLWDIGGSTPRFHEIRNDRVLARDFVIEQQLTPPF